MTAHRYDVVVVGGGLSGLRCARLLHDAGRDVHLVEASDRVGGRTSSPVHQGAAFDLGAQWIGLGQKRVYALARELGLATFPSYAKGRNLIELDGRVRGYRGKIPAMPLLDLWSAQRMMWRFERLARQVPVLDPTLAPRAAEHDRLSVAEFCRHARLRPKVVASLTSAFRVIFGAELEDVSLLHFLFYVHSAGGFSRMVDSEEGAQRDRLVEGTQALSVRLQLSLGARVTFSAPVRSVTQDEAGVRVDCEGRSFEARRAVVAVPPGLAARIAFGPAVPRARAAVCGRFHMGAAVKVHVLYPRAFWRTAGLTGEAVVTQGPVALTFDDTSHDGKVPALLAFIGGKPAREWAARPEAERQAEVVATLARLFGPEASAPTRLVEHDWSAWPWSLGGPVCAPRPRVWTEVGAQLRAPHGRVHWAGTEMAVEWTGYLEGALDAAERAAAEVLAAPA